jgi:hypothetical protein
LFGGVKRGLVALHVRGGDGLCGEDPVHRGHDPLLKMLSYA